MPDLETLATSASYIAVIAFLAYLSLWAEAFPGFKRKGRK